VNARSPPRLATWLLAELGRGCRVEALSGDLLEQFEQGRSQLWYWHQVAGALVLDLLDVLRAHALSFVAAILSGYAVTTVWELGCNWAFQSVYENLSNVGRHPWSLDALLRIAGMVGTAGSDCALSLLSASIVMRVHRAHQVPVLLAFISAQVIQHIPGMIQLVARAPVLSNVGIPLATQIILTLLHAATTLVAGIWVYRRVSLKALPRPARIFTVMWLMQMLMTTLLFAAHRVNVFAYSRPEGYLSLYGLEAACGVFLAFLLWRGSPGPVGAKTAA
jgi:hypothetical protein